MTDQQHSPARIDTAAEAVDLGFGSAQALANRQRTRRIRHAAIHPYSSHASNAQQPKKEEEIESFLNAVPPEAQLDRERQDHRLLWRYRSPVEERVQHQLGRYQA